MRALRSRRAGAGELVVVRQEAKKKQVYLSGNRPETLYWMATDGEQPCPARAYLVGRLPALNSKLEGTDMWPDANNPATWTRSRSTASRRSIFPPQRCRWRRQIPWRLLTCPMTSSSVESPLTLRNIAWRTSAIGQQAHSVSTVTFSPTSKKSCPRTI